MAKITVIQQGESLPFSFDRSGESLDGFVCVISVKQFPSDTALISRTIAISQDDDGNDVWSGFLTQTETAALALGLFYLTAKLSNTTTDEEEQVPVRFFVSAAWA